MHIEKFNRCSAGFILRHCENCSFRFSRDNVNSELSSYNYNFIGGLGYSNLNNVLSKVHCSKRKDLNVICSCVLTLPDKVPKEREQEFFSYAFEFLSKRYKSPCVSACCHYDEPNARPHLHYIFVPLVYDKKNNRFKVCAKEKITKADLKTLHQDFQCFIKENMGLDVPILNGATSNGNKTINQLKAETLESEIKLLEKKKTDLINSMEQVLCR